ncbi:glycine-rich cell wall structural protein 1.0-like [Miscanthus floridulus]|uniref:glycine-rich cell wall structural protein 1.0-like n=1 Tax=Miscanthus floridulus TaxID=154761 RepID=UPI003459A985
MGMDSRERERRNIHVSSVHGGRGPSAGRRERASSAYGGRTPGVGRLGPGTGTGPAAWPVAWPAVETLGAQGRARGGWVRDAEGRAPGDGCGRRTDGVAGGRNPRRAGVGAGCLGPGAGAGPVVWPMAETLGVQGRAPGAGCGRGTGGVAGGGTLGAQGRAPGAWGRVRAQDRRWKPLARRGGHQGPGVGGRGRGTGGVASGGNPRRAGQPDGVVGRRQRPDSLTRVHPLIYTWDYF